MDEEVNFNIKLPKSLRDAFAASCKSRDSTPSREIRIYMREYIKKHGQGDLFAGDNEKEK